MITTFGSPVAAAADGTITPNVAMSTKTRAAADLRKGTPRLDVGCEQLSPQTRARTAHAQSRDGPAPASPFGPVSRMTGRTGGVRVRADRGAGAPRGRPGADWSDPARRGSGGRPASPRARARGPRPPG